MYTIIFCTHILHTPRFTEHNAHFFPLKKSSQNTNNYLLVTASIKYITQLNVYHCHVQSVLRGI
jgi:hypothetical protein